MSAACLLGLGFFFQIVGYAVTVAGIGSRLGFFGDGHVLQRVSNRILRFGGHTVTLIRSAPERVRLRWRKWRPVIQHFTTPWGWQPKERRGTRGATVSLRGAANVAASAFSPGVVTTTEPKPLVERVSELEESVALLRERTDSLEEGWITVREKIDEVVSSEIGELRNEISEVFDSDVVVTLIGALFFFLGLCLSLAGALTALP